MELATNISSLNTSTPWTDPVTTTPFPYYGLYLQYDEQYDFIDEDDFFQWVDFQIRTANYTYDDWLIGQINMENMWSATISDKVVLYLLAALITFFGTTLNILVILIFSIGKRSSVKDIRVLLLNLAIVDFIWSASNPIAHTTDALKLNYPEGQDVLCGVQQFVSNVGGFGSLMFTAAIAVERLLVVCFPLLAVRTPHKHRIRTVLATLLWIALPCIFYRNIVTGKVQLVYNIDDNGKWQIYHDCHSTIKKGIGERSFTKLVIDSKIKYFVLIGIVVTCYTVIGIRLTCRKLIGERTTSSSKLHGMQVLRVVFIMSMFNIVYWIPVSVVQIFKFKFEDPPRPQIPRGYWYILETCMYLAFASTSMSPILYLTLNKDFREDTKDLLQRCGCSSTRLRRYTSHNTRSSTSTFNLGEIKKVPRRSSAASDDMYNTTVVSIAEP